MPFFCLRIPSLFAMLLGVTLPIRVVLALVAVGTLRGTPLGVVGRLLVAIAVGGVIVGDVPWLWLVGGVG